MGDAARQDGSGEDHLTAKESGIFTWDLETGMLHADGAVAKLFGLNASSVFAGLPIQNYVERICEEDRARVAQSIHHAIVTGDPYHEEYRVLGEDRKETQVMAFGRCFRDAKELRPTTQA